ncbi:fimbrial protein [Janthinobacterium lividum]|jgi:major type 1 subunit fimbrin (pilin)|uniref:fimbrial protein n=1 Tax=Janthinobacterium lividum TaxID=29581 RepID=UPI000875388B|nr:fimbrial protein [Janthinobacterium lividum]MCC7716974.1 type 1 fimbrial protein [Janthinobacterium lividum]OEZ53457.1 laminin-binding fimbrial subunit ElfA precursor [Janthinobacterium lividum]WQE31922.1 fimbrial protein [Janthinobacterium lividum]STS86192.1 ELF [Janthinobacterium lividum]
MHFHTRILAVLLAAAATQSAYASDGTINFSGELLDSTCTVTVNGQVAPSAATVTLPKLSASMLKTASTVAGQTPFNITLSACSGATTTAAAFFEGGAGVDTLTSNVKNSGTATFVELQLIDANNGSAIKAGDIGQVTGTTRITKNATGNTVLPYAVQYVSTGVATAGTVLGTVTYSISYQ